MSPPKRQVCLPPVRVTSSRNCQKRSKVDCGVLMSGPAVSRPSSVMMRKPLVPGTISAAASSGGGSTWFLKSVKATRKLLTSFEVNALSRPTAYWLVVLALRLPVEGRALPPKPPKFELSSRLQRKKAWYSCGKRQSTRKLFEVSRKGAGNDVRLGKYGVLMLMDDSSRVRSKFPNKKILSLRSGPPMFTPNCSRSKSGLVSAKPGRAEMAEARPKINALPCHRLVPLLVMMLTPPVALSPVEGSEEEVESWNSWMLSWERFRVVVPTCSSTASTPSRVMRVSRPLRPPTDTPV